MDSLNRDSRTGEQLLQSFDSYLRRRGRAASTRRQYSYSLRRFGDWLGDRCVGDLTAADLELFLTHWEAEFQTRHGRLPCSATMRGTIGALRAFFAYLEQTELLVGSDGATRRNPVRTIDAPRCTQRPNDFLRPYEDRALLNADCPHHHRIIVWVLRYTGVRVAEARALTVADIDLTADREALTGGSVSSHGSGHLPTGERGSSGCRSAVGQLRVMVPRSFGPVPALPTRPVKVPPARFALGRAVACSVVAV